MISSDATDHILPAMWRMEIHVSYLFRQSIEDLFENQSVAVSSFKIDDIGLWRIEAFLTEQPDSKNIEQRIRELITDQAPPNLHIEYIAEKNWLLENRNHFPPLEIGEFYIHASHLPASRTHNYSLKLDAGTAFGSGEHATTAGCLMALQDVAKCKNITKPLDMGCGSGILALAMASLWHVPVIASDIDLESMRVTNQNAKANNLHQYLTATSGNGYASSMVRKGAKYDLIVSNILANPLCKLSKHMSKCLQTTDDGGGVVILSGLLVKDGALVIAAHRRYGLRLIKRYIRDGWLTLWMER